MPAAAYAESFPAENAVSAFQILRSGKAFEQRSQLTKDVWWVAGFGAKVAVGEPTGAAAVGALSVQDTESVKDLATEIECFLEGDQPVGTLDAAAQRDWSNFRKFLEMALPLLKLFFGL